MIDHFGFTMGTLCDHAFVLAAPARPPTAEDKVW